MVRAYNRTSGDAVIWCNVDKSWIKYAEKKDTGKSFNHMTILESGRGQVPGTLGELGFIKFLKKHKIDYEYVADKMLPYDFVVNGIKVDIKTKLCTSAPKKSYSCHVAMTQKYYDADVYVFARTDMEKVYLLGYTDKSNFWCNDNQNAKDVKKGELDDDFFKEKENARKIKISDLTEMKHFKNEKLENILWLKGYNANS